MGQFSFPYSIPKEFWRIIAEARKGKPEYVHALANLSKHDLLGFIWILQELAAKIQDNGHGVYEPEDESDKVGTANWVVAQGEEHYREVYFDRDRFPENKPDPGLLRWAQEVYRARFHQDVPVNEWSWDDDWQQKKKRGPWR